MPYDSLIDRTGATALIPEQAAREIIQASVEQSAFMSLARKLPNMARAQERLPVLSAMPAAYFVNGDTGLKGTSSQAWTNKYINAEEIAVIVPIPEAVLDDADYDIWGEVRPRVAEAIGKVVDLASFHGTNKPASWPTAIVDGATAAGHTVTIGTNPDLYDDLLGESGTIQFIEDDGYMASGHVAAMAMRGRLRGVRAAGGEPIFQPSMQQRGEYVLDGEAIRFPRNGGVDPTDALLISGDWTQAVWAVRTDITFKLLDQAVIQDAQGAIVYNLAQQDMVALRAVFRMGWQIANPINALNTNDATRYPFTVLKPV